MLEIHLSCFNHFRMDNTFHTYTCVAYHLITQCGMYFVWGLFWREISSYIKHLELFRLAFLQGVAKKLTKRKKSQPKLSAVGLNFTMDMTWGRLILLSLSKKRPNKYFPGPSGANYWRMSIYAVCTLAPAAFY